MPTKTALQKLVEHGAEFAAHAFRETGQLMPMILADIKGGGRMVVPLPSIDDEVIQEVRIAFKMAGVCRYVFIDEIWTLTKADAARWKPGDPAPRKHPDRREALIAAGHEAGCDSYVGLAFILRPEHGPATVSPWDHTNCERSVGALASLLD